MKYIIEIEEKPLCVFDKDTQTYFPRLWRVKGFNSLVFDEEGLSRLEELTADYINEHFGSLQDEAYHRGLSEGNDIGYKDGVKDGQNEAWEAARKIALMDTETSENVTGYFGLFRIMENLTPMQAIEKLKAYEEKQKTDNCIEIGDEVQHGDSTGIVYDAGDLILSGLLTDDGPFVPFQWYKQECKKTGRHFDIMTPKQLENGAIQWRIKK